MQRLIALLLAGTALAGCMASAEESDIAVASYPAAFLVQSIAGDHLRITHLGQGVGAHDYEPNVGDLNRLRGADLLVLHGLGLEGWVDRAVQGLGDAAPEILLSAALPTGEGYLRPDHVHSGGACIVPHDPQHGSGGHSRDDHGQDHHGNGIVGGLDIIDRSSKDIVAHLRGDQFDGGLPPIPHDGHISIGAVFEDADGHEIPLGDEYTFHARLAHGDEAVVEIDSHGDHLHLRGKAPGETHVVFQLWHGDQADWESPAILARVVDDDGHGHDDYGDHDDHGHDGHGHDDHDGHEHEGCAEGTDAVDPHTWLDPLAYAQQARIVADALIERHPQHAEAFEARADELVTRLHTLHGQYRDSLADCALGTIVTNHSAYSYLGSRYGFGVVSLHSIEPAAQPSPNDVQRIISTIRDLGVPYMFIEEGADANALRAIQQATGVKVAPLHTLETKPGQGDWFSTMSNNLGLLQEALRCH